MDFFEVDSPTDVTPFNDLLNESTGIAWLGRNLEKIGNPEYIGTAHYRRYLDVREDDLSHEKIFCHVESQPFNIFKTYCYYHVGEDLKEFNTLFSRKHQEYAVDLNDFMNLREYASRNMFVIHRDLFLDYCVFQRKCLDILLEMARTVDFRSRDKYQKRAIGFIMERMTGFWIYLAKKAGNETTSSSLIDIEAHSPYQRT